jgi:RNA polymerase sigma-70 factor (ECF subfamily)
MADPILITGMRRCERLGDPDDADGAVAAAVARAQAGETDAIGFLYRRYAPNVRAYVTKIVGDEHDAEDVTQHLFAKLMTSALSRYQPRSLPFSRWLLRVARNLAIDHVRARRPVPAGEAQTNEIAPDEQAGRECLRSLSAALQALPADQRDVVVLRHVVGLSPGEVARKLRRTRGSVTGLNHRGRRALCRNLIQLDSAPAVRGGGPRPPAPPRPDRRATTAAAA